jgi:hypothetical protein
MRRLPAILACLGVVLFHGTAFAGTLCGTVTDRETTAPVAHAGIFLRTPAGAYTGIYGATDVTGVFCISSVPPATYDIEVRVDDYRIAYLRGVVVTGTVDVTVDASSARLRLAPPFPNPAIQRTTLRWTLAAPSSVELTIHDVRGRFVRGWHSTLPPGEHSLEWNLLDHEGRSTPPGLYYVRLRAAGTQLVQSLVRTR